MDRTLLARVPADANHLSLSSFDFAGILPAIRQALGEGEAEALENALGQIETTSQIKVESLLQTLGPGTAFFSRGSSGGMGISAMQSVDLSLGLAFRDCATVVQAVNRLQALAEDYQSAQASRLFEIEHTTVNAVEIQHLAIQDFPFAAMFSPAWAAASERSLDGLREHGRPAGGDCDPQLRPRTLDRPAERLHEQPQASRWRQGTVGAGRSQDHRRGGEHDRSGPVPPHPSQVPCGRRL